jgi:hypothetical protein
VDTETWYERAAWIWFALLTASVLPLALVVLADPSRGGELLWARFGHGVPPAIVADPAATAHVEFIAHWAMTGSIGFDLFGLLIALTAFRRGERWAWLAFWYWPVMFAIHFTTYSSGFRYFQLVWAAMSVAALLATRRKVWRAPDRRDATPMPAAM